MDINDLLLLRISQKNRKEEKPQKDVVFTKYFKDEELRGSGTLLRELSTFEDKIHPYFGLIQHSSQKNETPSVPQIVQQPVSVKVKLCFLYVMCTQIYVINKKDWVISY